MKDTKIRLHKFNNSAFTIVELVVIIAVIGILAGISTVGYGEWRTRTANSEVQSDLKQAVIAMESDRNFSSGYPTGLPSSFSASDGVTITYQSGDATQFCIEGRSKLKTSVVYFVNTQNSKDPLKGNCTN